MCFPRIFPMQCDVSPPGLGWGSSAGCAGRWGWGPRDRPVTLPCPTAGSGQLFLPLPLPVLSWPIWLSPLIYWDIFSRLRFASSAKLLLCPDLISR